MKHGYVVLRRYNPQDIPIYNSYQRNNNIIPNQGQLRQA